VSQTRYARSGDVSVAYQVRGEGSSDVVIVPGSFSNVDLLWDLPGWGQLVTKLAANHRVIAFDKRGTGLSDPVVGAPDMETRMDDVRAVLDAVKSERASILGISEGGPMSMLFAATYPERISRLILFGTLARNTWAPGYTFPEFTDDEWRSGVREDTEAFRRDPEGVVAAMVRSAAPEAPDDEIAAYIPYFTRGTTPAMFEALALSGMFDVRDVLSAVRVPTLIIQHDGDPWVVPQHGRYLAQHIPGARYVELRRSSHLLSRDSWRPVYSEITSFLAEAGADLDDDRSQESDRSLLTILFTDIVASTATAAELGDHRWREVVGEHHQIVRRELARFGGREANTMGDGFLATFDGPARAVRCAISTVGALAERGITIRAGLHSGECELVENQPAGLAVHIGARVAAQAGPGEVVVSQTVRDLIVGSDIGLAERPSPPPKGVPGEWKLYSVLPT
jgi:pimeloyl-ACP methyl ester carboxylesterase